MGVSFRTIAILTAALTLGACATTPKAPVRAAADTPLAVIGIGECNELKGIIVVTKSGEVVAVSDSDPADLAALAKGLPEGSAGDVDLTDNCLPSQKTKL